MTWNTERRALRAFVTALAIALLAACGSPDRGPTVRIYDGSWSNPNDAQHDGAGSASSGSHRVSDGETLFSISKTYDVSLRALIERNNLQPPYTLRVGQILSLPVAQAHTVARGDTVYGISRRYGVAMNALVRANDIAPPYTIQVGQRLVIPATVRSRPATTTSTGVSTTPAPATNPSESSGSVDPDTPFPQAKPTPPQREDTQAAADPTAGSAQPSSSDPPSSQPLEKGIFLVDRTFIPPAKPPPPPRIIGPIQRPPPLSGDGFIWPARGRVLSGFGPKERGLHNDGINIAAPRGTAILASETGVVAYAGDALQGFGNMILIKHADGFVTAYAHAEEILVRRGQVIRRGQAIAKVGSTGTVDAPQVHFQIRKGRQAIDPRRFLLSS